MLRAYVSPFPPVTIDLPSELADSHGMTKHQSYPILTVTEARDAGLVIPGFAECEEPDEFLIVHDPEGDVCAWGPSWDRRTLENIVRAFR